MKCLNSHPPWFLVPERDFEPIALLIPLLRGAQRDADGAAGAG